MKYQVKYTAMASISLLKTSKSTSENNMGTSLKHLIAPVVGSSWYLAFRNKL